ncbi:amidotransferase [bacterium]|nr:MAG: amidotransferase [bacterium]
MHIHAFYHASFEGLGSIREWMDESGFTITETHWYQPEPNLPDIRELDVLIVMGGPMGIYDETEFPWLIHEKKLIKEAISLHKKVLGICLGSQLLADAFGARVYPHTQKEIGWFPVQRYTSSHPLAAHLPVEQTVFHWHGDTFDLPEHADLLASSSACKHQAFAIGDSVLGLQFHLEVESNDVQKMVKHGEHELTKAPFIQSKEVILSENQYFETNESLLHQLLNAWLSL